VGEYTSVSGPVVSTYYAEDSNGQPTFINVGRDYPDPSRFTVVIWGDSRANFEQPPEKAYDGKVICVTGVVTIYQGAAQIEVAQPSQIVVKS
jgi:DNA/RNA endonuclease YhcR with UshA esterase domain